MSIDTTVKLIGYVSPEEVLSFIRAHFDPNGFIHARAVDDFNEIDSIKERYDDSGRWKTEHCWIHFKHPNEMLDQNRCIFYCHSNVNFYENLDYYKDRGLEDMVKAHTTYLSLGCWGKSIEIMKAIVEHFGGWLDENDCDESEYYKIDKAVGV